MMNSSPFSSQAQYTQVSRVVDRAMIIQLVHSALENSEFQFARQAALQWIASFPGDLTVSLGYARALFGEQKYEQAINILKGLSQTDPEYLQAVALLNQAIDLAPAAKGLALSFEEITTLGNWQVALSGEQGLNSSGAKMSQAPAPWGEQYWMISQAFSRGDLTAAETDFHSILGHNPATPLIAVMHLKLLNNNPGAPLQARRSMAEYYHRRWPNCLTCSIYLSLWLMEAGEADRALPLLHQVSARDTGGQTIRRLLGVNHPYQPLWPEKSEIKLTIAVPASVTAALGLNRLQAGPVAIHEENLIPVQSTDASAPIEEIAVLAAASSNTVVETDEEILLIKAEFDRLSKSLNQPPVTSVDGRYPTYVIFSLHSKLETQYGKNGAADIETLMERLAKSISTRLGRGLKPHWAAALYLADQPDSAAALGLEPVTKIDTWNLKLALKNLDAALAKHGQMIGALLIVGGNEIIPFHELPNPVDDPDTTIQSDSPYATRDDNYFIPEWPVGRLPGGAGNNPQLLIKALQRLNNTYTNKNGNVRLPARFWAWMTAWRNPARPASRKSFGYSAAVWKQASISVFRPVGEARGIAISPPFGINGNGNSGRSISNAIPKAAARLGYFNLHGLVDSAEWYGQRDPASAGDGPDYPVALRPADIQNLGAQIPQVVFSEACYGAHILNKTADQSLALRFLASGSQAIAASTAMSYGSIQAPLVAADLLGFVFWKGLQSGLSAGEALRRAKISLANEMNQRQGYLDGEDQKTLISFILIGDPLARPAIDSKQSRLVLRASEPAEMVKMICDRADSESCNFDPISSETLEYVKHVVSNYLPGMHDASISSSNEHAVCTAQGHECPTSQLHPSKQPAPAANRKVFVLSKSIEKSGLRHHQLARITLDAQDKLVKMVVSR